MYKFLWVFALISVPTLSWADDGLLKFESIYDVSTTTDKLELLLQNKGMTIFNRINHASGAKKVGKVLRPTETIIFGNPKIGTLLMQCNQEAAIDLPQKALIWQDADHHVWLAFNQPEYLKQRHHLQACDPVIQNITKALTRLGKAATQ